MRRPATLQVGDSPRARDVGPLTITDFVRFAGAGGDFNPLHHDEAAARAAGFGGVIAMGQFTAGVLAAFLTDWVGIEHLQSFEVRFVSPVVAGELLTLTAEVVELRDVDALVALRARVDARDVVTATARVTRSASS